MRLKLKSLKRNDRFAIQRTAYPDIVMSTTGILTRIIAAMLLLASVCPAPAQNKQGMIADKERYKQVSGRYGSMDGICLFDDGRFLLYGYATAVFGRYGFEKDNILFYPDKPERFQVYACNNKSTDDSTRLFFRGFEEGATFVQLDNKPLRRVFNEDANCFNTTYIATPATAPARIALFDKVAEEEGWYKGAPVTSWHYDINKGYNDFILIYNKPHRYYNDFSGRITQVEEGTWVLTLSANFGSRQLGKHPAEEEDKNWAEILEWKAGAEQSGASDVAVYANPSFHTFPVPDSLNYKYDAALDAYVDVLNKDNDSYYQDNAYNDDRYLRKYTKLQPQKKDSTPFEAKDVAATPVFYVVCEGEPGSNNIPKAPEEAR